MNERTRIGTTLAILLLPAMSGCGAPSEVDQEQANNLAAGLEAGANNATDDTQADVLREQANSLREAGRGNEAAGEGMVATNAE